MHSIMYNLKNKWHLVILKIMTVSLLLSLFSGCVTTTTSNFSQKKDLQKAENTYVQIGFSHIKETDYASAKKAFDRALSINKSSAGALMGLGIIYSTQDEPVLAKKMFMSAIKNDGTQEARFQYAIWRYNVQDFKTATSELTKVVKDTSYLKRANAFDILGLLALRLEKPEDAVSHFQKAIALNRQLVNSYINLANAYMVLNNPVEAYKAYNGFVSLAQIDLTKQNASTLWMGIQLSYLNEDKNAFASYGNQLKEMYPDSEQAKIYLKWKESL